MIYANKSADLQQEQEGVSGFSRWAHVVSE